MRRLSRVLVLVVVGLLVVGSAPVAAGGSHSLKATFEGPTDANLDPDDVAARCPADFGWIFGGSGTGAMTSAAYTGDFTIEYDHCSRWVVFDPERPTGRYVGKSAAGLMTITTPVGELWLEYIGTWVLEGDVPADFTADMHLRYTIVGGDDVFDGASGHGRLSMTVGSFPGTGLLNGSLHTPG